MTIIDTSVLVLVERRKLHALELVAELLEAGQLAVSTVTVHELLRSPRMPDEWRAFWLDFFSTVELVDLDLEAAEAAATIWADELSRDKSKKLDVGDVLIAGTARAIGADVVTDDEGFGELVSARLVRPS